MGHRPGIKGGYFPVPPVDSATDIRAEANSDDAIVGLRLANTASSTINVDVLITNSSNTTLATIIKSCPIPQGSSLELIDGGAKILYDPEMEVNHHYTDNGNTWKGIG